MSKVIAHTTRIGDERQNNCRFNLQFFLLAFHYRLKIPDVFCLTLIQIYVCALIDRVLAVLFFGGGSVPPRGDDPDVADVETCLLHPDHSPRPPHAGGMAPRNAPRCLRKMPCFFANVVLWHHFAVPLLWCVWLCVHRGKAPPLLGRFIERPDKKSFKTFGHRREVE